MALSLDGYGANSGAGPNGVGQSGGTVSITTSDANDIIVLCVYSEDQSYTAGTPPYTVETPTNTGTATLTWHLRKSFTNTAVGGGQELAVWWAYAASAGTYNISWNYTEPLDGWSAFAFGVNGANTSNPWDSNPSLPYSFTNTDSYYGASTSAANTFTFVVGGGTSSGSAASPWTSAGTPNNNTAGGHDSASCNVGYQIFSSAQANFQSNDSQSGTPLMITDAIVQVSEGGSVGPPDFKFSNKANNGRVASGSSLSSIGLSQVDPNDIIVWCVHYETDSSADGYGGGYATTTTISDTDSLTWTLRKRIEWREATNQTYNTLEIWWALASTFHTNSTWSLTATPTNADSGQGIDGALQFIFNASNCNTTAPWDTSSQLPVSTTNTNDSAGADEALAGCYTKDTNALPFTVMAGTTYAFFNQTFAAPTGGGTWSFTDTNNGSGANYKGLLAAWVPFAAQFTNQTVTFSNPTSNFGVIFDALTSDASVVNTNASWASTETADAMDFVGSPEGPPTGSWHSTEAHDTWAATGFPELPNGSWFVTEPTDTASIHGYTGTPPVITNYVTGGAADSGGSGITSANVTLSTPVAGELIVVQVTTGGYFHHGFPAESPVPISDTAGLTWHLRSSFTPPADPDFDEPSQINCQVWWAEAPAALTSDVITVETASATGFIAITAIAIVGGVGFDGNADLPDEVDNGGSGEPNVTVSTSGTTRSLLLAFYFSNGGAALQETSVNAPLTGLISGTLESEHDGWEVATNIGYGSITSALSSESFQPFNDSAGHFNGRAVIIDCINGPLTGTFTTTDTKDTMSVHGGLVGGHWTSTEPHDRMDFAPYTGEYGYWDSTETPDAMAFSGGLLQTFWDPSFTSDGVDLQSLDLTIVNQEAFNLPVGSRSNTSHSTGKFYAEFGMWVSSNQSGVGIGNASAVPASWGGIAGNSPGPASNGAGIFQNENGTIWVDEVQQTNSYDLALQGGVIVSVAVDLNANLIWFRQNGNYWNGIAGANPATGAGGYDISGIAGGLIYLFGTVYGQQDKIIMNPGSSAFTYGVPSGFIAWDSAPPLNPPLTLDGYASAGINETGGRIGNPGFDTGTVTLSTSLPNDVIVLGVAMGGYYNADTVDTVTSTSGLTWKRRHQRWQVGGYKSGGSTTVNQGLDIEIWWAHAPTALTNEVITVTSGGQNVGGMALIAFGVNGANYTTPWDTHSQAGGYVENGGEIFYFPGQAQLSTKANSTFLFGIHGDTQADAGVAQAPWTYVTSAEGFEVDGDSSFASFLYQVVEEPQFATDVLVGQIYAGGPTYLANSVMFDSIVSAGETGTDQEIVWFWDANSVNGILQLTTGNSLTLGYSATNFNLMVLIQVMIQSASGNGEVASISEGQGSLSSAGFQRRSRKTTVTESGNLAVEIWWGWMPMHTAAERANNDTIIINTVNTTSGDIIGATMWGLGGSTGAFGLGDPFWDINPSVPAENASDGSSPPPYATNISTTIPSDLLVAWTGNLNENVPVFTDPYVTLLQDYPFTVQPIFPLNSNAPPFYTGFEFFYSPGLVTDETAEFLNGSPEPAGWIVIADAIPVGPPQPPTGVLDTTDSQDKFTHNGNFTAIGIANTVGWVGYPACYGTIATTDHEDINGGTPNLGYSPFLGEGWLGWVPAFAAWHSTDHDDSDSFYGWIINTRCTGQLVGVETVDRWASSEHALGPVSGSWHSTEHKDYWSSSGFEIPKVPPPAPIKRRLLIIT